MAAATASAAQGLDDVYLYRYVGTCTLCKGGTSMHGGDIHACPPLLLFGLTSAERQVCTCPIHNMYTRMHVCALNASVLDGRQPAIQLPLQASTGERAPFFTCTGRDSIRVCIDKD
jgi:hypothetical protein